MAQPDKKIVLPLGVFRHITPEGAILDSVQILHGDLGWDEWAGLFPKPVLELDAKEWWELLDSPAFPPCHYPFQPFDAEGASGQTAYMTMVYPIYLEGFAAEFFLALRGVTDLSYGSVAQALVGILKVALVGCNEPREVDHTFLFEDTLQVIFNQIVSFHIPRVVPLGKAELDGVVPA